MLAACSFDSSPGSVDTAGLGDTDSDSSETSETVTASDGTSTTGATGSGSSPSTDPSDPSDPTTDPSDPTTDPSDPTTDPSDPTDPTDPTTDSDTDSTTDPTDPTTGSDTDPTGGTAAMVTVEGNDFGDVDYETTPTREYTLTNEGGQPADNLALAVVGAFALDSDDCPGSLGPGESCTATVSHNAATLGPFSGDLEVDYDSVDGPQDVMRELTVEVTGETGNLIPDPGFENCATFAEPAGWDLLTEDGWYCGGDWATPHEGNRFLSGGGPLPDQNNFNIRFVIDLTPYQNAISTDLMAFEFRGYATSAVMNNDFYRLRVRYRNAGGVNQTVYSSNVLSTADWTLYSDLRVVPSNVTEAFVELHCQKSGGNDCDAFFDTLSLVGSYEPN